MIVKQITDTRTYLDAFRNYRQANLEVLLIGTTTDLTVYDTGRGDINHEAAEKYNAIIIPLTSNGGSAITLPGDIGLYYGTPGHSVGWCKFVFSKLIAWLSTQGILAGIRNNDLTIFGKKFAGYTEHPSDTYSTGLIFVAMNNAQELVREICTKPKTKNTIGLRDFGLIADDIINVVIQATNEYLEFTKGDK